MSIVTPLHLHTGTLLLSIALFAFLTSALSYSSARAIGGDQRGLPEWSKAMAYAGGAFMLYFLRGHAPALLTFLLANALALIAAVYTNLAYSRFFDVSERRWLITAFAAAGFGGVLANHFFGVAYSFAVLSMSSAVAALFVMNVCLIVRGPIRGRTLGSAIAASGMLVVGAACAARAFLAVIGDGTSVAMNASTGLQAAALIVGGWALLSASVGFVLMAHERRRLDILEKARRDTLTGVLTRRAFFEGLSEVERQTGESYALVMVDVDHFKAINDRYGHAGGDAVLVRVGDLLVRSARASDFAGRYGGEEFCVLLRGCGEPEAARFAGRLVAEAAASLVRMPDGTDVPFTLSAGYATGRVPFEALVRASPLTHTLGRADTALYEAKRAGRNRAHGAATDSLPEAVWLRRFLVMYSSFER